MNEATLPMYLCTCIHVYIILCIHFAGVLWTVVKITFYVLLVVVLLLGACKYIIME